MFGKIVLLHEQSRGANAIIAQAGRPALLDGQTF